MKILKYSLLGMIVFPLSGNAIGIDSMLEFTVQGQASFTITNSAEFRQFLHVGINELSVLNGELVSTPYTRDNIDQWTLSVRPARTVIEPGLNKTFQVSTEVSGESEVDRAYQLTFIPTPYFGKGEEQTHSVQVAIGFAPVVIVPAKEDKPIHYTMRYIDGQTMELMNSGKTYLRALIDACPSDMKGEVRKTCSTVVNALSGRNLPIELSKGMQGASQVRVELTTHNLEYRQEFSLSPGQVSKG